MHFHFNYCHIRDGEKLDKMFLRSLQNKMSKKILIISMFLSFSIQNNVSLQGYFFSLNSISKLIQYWNELRKVKFCLQSMHSANCYHPI